MAVAIAIPNSFQAQAGPIPLVQLDQNFTAIGSPLSNLATYSNYLIDSSGAANTITLTTAPGLSAAYVAGLQMQVLVANTNTNTVVNLNLNALGPQLVKNADGSALAIGQLFANSIINLVYDGVNFRLTNGSPGALFGDGTAASPSIAFTNSPTTGFYRFAANAIGFTTAGVSRGNINATGNWTIAAPTSGVAAQINAVANNFGLQVSAGVNTGNTFTMRVIGATGAGFSSGLYIQAGTNGADSSLLIRDATGVNNYMSITGQGEVVVGPAISGRSLSVNTPAGTFGFYVAPPASGTAATARIDCIAGATALQIMDEAGLVQDAGYRGVPQNSQAGNYAIVLADRGKSLYKPSGAASTMTIPANASVAFPIGTTLTFVNDSAAGGLLVAITTDVLAFSPSGATGTRTIAQFGMATAIKVTATRWIISGSGIT